jgi:uncharacterized protein YbjT (DUF2867 family)
MRTLVIGGTGTAGRHTVAELLRRGHQVHVASRRGGADLPGATGVAVDVTTGAGLAAALDGVEAVVDCANVATMRTAAAVRYFEGSTRRITRAAAAAGVRHHVVLSIVGVDVTPIGYYAGKLAQEHAALAGPVPATVLRATQFHELAGQMLARGGFGPLALVPAMPTQPVAAAEVGAALADVVAAGPAGRAPDVGGPRREYLPDLARLVLRRRGRRVLVVPVGFPGAGGRAIRDGSLLLGPDGQVRGPSFAEWLAAGA